MALKIQNSRQLLKRSTVSGATPTVFTGSTDYTDGTWGVDDIYAGELYLNMEDKKLWFGWETTGGTGVELIYPQTGTPGPSFTGGSGNCITDFYLTNMYGCSPINVWDNLYIQTGKTISTPDLRLNIFLDNLGEPDFVLGMFASSPGPSDNAQFRLTPTYQELLIENGGTQEAKLQYVSSNEIHLGTTVNTGEIAKVNILSNEMNLQVSDASTYNNVLYLNSTEPGCKLESEDLFNGSYSNVAIQGQSVDPKVQLLSDNLSSLSYLDVKPNEIELYSTTITMNGDVNAIGLTATTISATTYFNTPFQLTAAASDETTAITTGTTKVTFRMPCMVELTEVRASLTTAQTSGSTFTVDINSGGTSILSTKITIDNTEKTSTTAATPPVLSSTIIDDDAEMTVDVDVVGSGTATGLKVTLIGKQI